MVGGQQPYERMIGQDARGWLWVVVVVAGVSVPHLPLEDPLTCWLTRPHASPRPSVCAKRPGRPRRRRRCFVPLPVRHRYDTVTQVLRPGRKQYKFVVLTVPATPTATPPASPPKPARYVASTPAAASPERGATDLESPVVGSTVPMWVLEQHTQMVHATLPRNKGSRTEATPTAKPNASGALPTVGTPAAPARATAGAQPQVAPPLVLPLAGVQGGGRKLEALQHRAAPKPAAVGTMRMEDMLRSAMMAAASDERKTKAFEEMLQRYREHPGVVRRKQEEEAARKQRMEVVNRACYWSEKKRIPEGVRPNHKLLDDFVAVGRM